jgi:hypothetical protein
VRPSAAAGGDAVLAIQGSFAVTSSGQHYYELDDPAAALAALEHDMAALMMSVEKVGACGHCTYSTGSTQHQLLLPSASFLLKAHARSLQGGS